MKAIRLLLLLSLFSIPYLSSAQCKTWNDLEIKDELENDYVLYRSYLLTGEMAKAYDHWIKIYKVAPGLDGRKRPFLEDGRYMYYELFKQAKEKEERKEMAEIIVSLYKQEKACFPDETPVPIPAEVLEYIPLE